MCLKQLAVMQYVLSVWYCILFEYSATKNMPEAEKEIQIENSIRTFCAEIQVPVHKLLKVLRVQLVYILD